jgi:hypothetical protein
LKRGREDDQEADGAGDLASRLPDGGSVSMDQKPIVRDVLRLVIKERRKNKVEVDQAIVKKLVKNIAKVLDEAVNKSGIREIQNEYWRESRIAEIQNMVQAAMDVTGENEV